MKMMMLRLPNSFGEIDSNRFSVCVNSNKLVLVDCSWVKTFVDDLKEDKIDSVSITANYGIASTEKEPITAFAYIKTMSLPLENT